MKTLKKINDGFIKVSEYVAFVLSAIVCAMIVWWAFKRYVFASEFYGAEELILAIAFWMYFIGAYIATHEDSTISLVALGMLTWLSWEFLSFDIVRHKITVMYRFPQAWIHAVLPLSFALSCIYTIAHMVDTVIEIHNCGRKGESGSDQAALPDQENK